MTVWLLIAAIGALTYALRFSLIWLFGGLALPTLLRRALRFVPAAVLAALVVPAFVYAPGTAEVALDNPRLWAGALAVLVAWRTRSVLGTLLAGMGALYALRWLIG